MLGDDHLGAALVQVRDDIVAVEGRVADQRVKGEPVDERRHADRVEPLSWQEHKTYEVAQRVGERQDFGGQAAFGAANSLALRPPFAPCPCRWTLTMVASTRTYSRSGSSETASNSRCQTSAFTQSRKRVKTLFQFPNKGGRSRQGLPVRTIHSTASTNRRLSLPLRPGSPGLPKQRGSIFAHWASVSTKRSIRGVKHSPARMKSVNPKSGRIEARTGLRMMPTFPRSPLSFRTAGFPQYGWKAGLSGGAFPDRQRLKPAPRIHLRTAGLPSPFVHLRVGAVAPSCAGPLTMMMHRPGGWVALRPRGPRSGPGYAVPVRPRLTGPIRPTRRHIATSPQGGFYAMPSLCVSAEATRAWFRAFTTLPS